MAHAALKVIRPVLRVTSALAPGAVGRLAFRLFCTPVGHARVDALKPVIARALAQFADGQTRLVPHAAGYARVTRFEPAGMSRGTVLLVHGWTGQALFMAGFVRPLIEAGFTVLAMDLPGHGGSSGRELNFPLAIEAIEAVTRGHLPLAGIIGHSFGGAVAISAVAGGVATVAPLAARRIVTVAAPDDMAHYGRLFTATLGLTRRGHLAFERSVLAIAGRPMASFSSGAYLRDLKVPTLVIHAPDDKEIPFSDAEAMAAAGDHVSLQAAPGLGHRRILMSSLVQESAAAFIAAGFAMAKAPEPVTMPEPAPVAEPAPRRLGAA